MKILLVENNAADASAIADLLMQLRHEVFSTQNGNDALDHYIRHRPDLVIVSPLTKGIDGYSLTQQILRYAAPRWQPVVFLFEAADDRMEAHATEVGADACFIKPVTATSLAPRLAAIGHLLRVQDESERQLAEMRLQLVALQTDLEEARHLIEYQMVQADGRPFEDPAISLCRFGTGRGSDMVLAARTPEGCLHLMLADAADSGLPACISLQSLIAPFRRMTERGCSLAALARELNRKLRVTLPRGCVVSAQLASVAPGQRFVSIWNGGMPPAFMLDEAGHPSHEFPLLHAALGVLDDADFDDRVDQHAGEIGDQLVLVSDGVFDAVGLNGARFGEEGLAAALVGVPRGHRRSEAEAALRTHLGGTLLTDDMTLVLVDCDTTVPSISLPPPGVLHDGTPGNWCYALRLDAAALRKVEAVPLMLGALDHFAVSRAFRDELFIVLTELFDNALEHGLLRLDARLKHSPEGLETWLLMREERLDALTETGGEIRLWVEQVVESGRLWLRVRCQDTGSGFDLNQVLGPSVALGRGLGRMKQLAHFADISAQGSEIRVLLRLGFG